MARIETKVSRKQVAAIVDATFPEYTGRKISLVAESDVYIYDLNWGGGTRNQYRGCTLDGQPIGNLDGANAAHPRLNALLEGSTGHITPGMVVVRHSIFCGRDTGLTISVHPDDMPRLLPPPTAEG